jgi:regulator of sigma E protease
MTTLLAIDWAIVGIKAGQLILCLSILVILHEMGHFLPAKWFKCRVEKFYLFFDPWFSLFKKKIGETVYGIGWLPLGGYVKISGMIDESMDKEQMKLPPQPYEFRSKPAWQRLIIMIGGVTVNLVLGFFLFAMILWVWGDEYLPAKNVKYGVYVDSLGQKIGLQDGDKITGINGKELENFGALSTNIILNEAKTIEIDRNGQSMSLPVPEGTIRNLIKRKGDPLAYPKFPTVVDSVNKDAKFTSGILQPNDEIIGFNGQQVRSLVEFNDIKKRYKDEKQDKEVDLTVRRGEDTVHVKAILEKKENSYWFYFRQANKFLTFATKKYGFWESFPAGVKKGWGTLIMNVQNFKLLFTSSEVKASESLGSFLSIGNMFGARWDWERFWSMTALLSIVLAFMNILPIPALDGGHVLFTLYEMITGRKPGDKFMEYAQMVGMILLLGIMAYALGLDFWRFLFKN